MSASSGFVWYCNSEFRHLRNVALFGGNAVTVMATKQAIEDFEWLEI